MVGQGEKGGGTELNILIAKPTDGCHLVCMNVTLSVWMGDHAA